MRVTLHDYYFSAALRWILFSVGVLCSIYLLFMSAYELLSILSVLLALIAISTKYKLVIDTKAHIIEDSFDFLWITTRIETHQYQRLNVIVTDKERHVYTTNSRGRSGQADFAEYIALLSYDDETIELVRKLNYQEFIKKIRKVAELLKIPIQSKNN